MIKFLRNLFKRKKPHFYGKIVGYDNGHPRIGWQDIKGYLMYHVPANHKVINSMIFRVLILKPLLTLIILLAVAWWWITGDINRYIKSL